MRKIQKEVTKHRNKEKEEKNNEKNISFELWQFFNFPNNPNIFQFISLFFSLISTTDSKYTKKEKSQISIILRSFIFSLQTKIQK